MEKKIVKKVIHGGTYEELAFVASDGQKFDGEYECKLHEMSLPVKKLKEFTASIFGIYPEAYLAVTKDDVHNLFAYYDGLGNVHGKFAVGWNFITQEHTNYECDYYVWTKAYFSKSVKAIKKLMEAKNE